MSDVPTPSPEKGGEQQGQRVPSLSTIWPAEGLASAVPLAIPPDQLFPTGHKRIRLLGKGGAGSVYLVEMADGTQVALKEVELGSPLGQREKRAIEAVRDLNHPHLLSITAVVEHENYLYVQMELADSSLSQYCRSTGKPSRQGLLAWTGEAACALDFLHSRPDPIVHRDIKPANLLLVKGTLKVGDLGLAVVLTGRSRSHSEAHTLEYAAPEMLMETPRVSPPSDQYSLAMVYAELSMGVHPFESFKGDRNAMRLAHLHVPPSLGKLLKNEQAVVARALHKDKEARYPNCVAFVEALLHPGTLAPVDLSQLWGISFDKVGDLARNLRHLYLDVEICNAIRQEFADMPDPTRRQWLCALAGQFGGQEAQRWLEQLRDDDKENELVRRAAQSELEMMTSPRVEN